MNNEELKKKMVEIIIDAIWKDAEADYDSTDESEARTIADALIAAGLGDVKDLQAQVNALEMTNIALQAGYDGAEKDRLYWVNKYKEAEHRAEVAEMAFFNFALYCAKTVSPDYVRNTSEENQIEYAKDICKEWREQAEKELAEDRK